MLDLEQEPARQVAAAELKQMAALLSEDLFMREGSRALTKRIATNYELVIVKIGL